jgi:hypothetical protein
MNVLKLINTVVRVATAIAAIAPVVKEVKAAGKKRDAA